MRIFNDIYDKYFDKDKPLRHYTQHALVALIFLAPLLYFDRHITALEIVAFSLSVYLIDLDTLLTLMLSSKKYPEFYDEVTKSLKQLDLMKAAEVATRKHKQIDNLILHNIAFFLLLIVLDILFIILYKDLNWVIYSLSATISHCVFDILDDYYQIKSFKHWFNIFK